MVKVSVATFCAFVILIIPVTAAVRSTGLSEISECICEGYSAVYECTVEGPGSTVWKGGSFRDCPNNRITLFHSQFRSGTNGTCNAGSVVGRSVRVEGSCYTSQLNIITSPDVVGTTIFCAYDDGLNEMDIGNSTVTLTTVPLSPPSNLSLTSATPNQLTFAWDPVVSSCPATKYNIRATNCGTCPSSTPTTNVTCSNPQPQPNAGVTCTFSVRTETCEGVISDQSEIVSANLKVPDVPMFKIVPIYLQNGILTSLRVTIMELMPFSISDGIDGSAQFYNINVANSTLGEPCGFVSVPSSSCSNSVCITEYDVSSSPCLNSSAFFVTVFASNVFGDGEISYELTFGMMNNFVDIIFDPTSKQFTCEFTNKQDASEKTCSITLYRTEDCEQRQTLMLTAQVVSTDSQLTLVPNDLESDTTIYCYVASASNDTFNVNVTGTIGQRGSPQTTNVGAIAGGVVGALVVIAAIIVLVILGLSIWFGKIPCLQRIRYTDETEDGAGENLRLVENDCFTILKVEEECELKDFIEGKNIIFQRGAAFYEFTRAEEDIKFGKEVVLMDKKTRQLYTGQMACDMIGAPGEKIKKPELKKYRVFVQSKGIGNRPLEVASLVLYERNPDPDHDETNFKLKPVNSSRFQILQVTSDCELRDFVESDHKLPYKAGCAFFEFKKDKEDINERKEVLLMDKKTGEIFTGPGVLSMIGAPGKDVEPPSLNRWRVFIQSLYNGARCIYEDTIVLYENLGSDTEDLEMVGAERLEILDVLKTCSLRDFVENTHQLKPYNPRRFFFEFSSAKEEITDDKEIILMDKDTKKMFTGLKAKEMIGAPGKGVSRPSLNKYRVFVQNGGGGQRCLKQGTSLLYERKYKF